MTSITIWLVFLSKLILKGQKYRSRNTRKLIEQIHRFKRTFIKCQRLQTTASHLGGKMFKPNNLKPKRFQPIPGMNTTCCRRVLSPTNNNQLRFHVRTFAKGGSYFPRTPPQNNTNLTKGKTTTTTRPFLWISKLQGKIHKGCSLQDLEGSEKRRK